MFYHALALVPTRTSVNPSAWPPSSWIGPRIHTFKALKNDLLVASYSQMRFDDMEHFLSNLTAVPLSRPDRSVRQISCDYR